MKGRSVAVAVGVTMVVCCWLLLSGCDRNPPDGEYVLTGTNAQGFREYLCLRDSSIMVRIPKGTFTMGDTVNPDEMPVHSVHLGEYLIDKCEITNKQYKWFCDSTGTAYPHDPDFTGMDDYFVSFPDFPVVMVSWLDAAAYATWAHKSIATEAQWEKAGRGADARRYPWGDAEPNSTLCNMVDGDTFSHTSPVGQFAGGASFYGCMDLAGNVWEWCNDWYSSDYYTVSPGSNPTGPDSGYYRVARGGSYNNGQSVWLRCAERYWGPESGGNHPALGFRCAVVW